MSSLENTGSVGPLSGGRRKRSELLHYYDAGTDNSSTRTPPALDLLSNQFDSKLYAQKLIKECSLKQLLEEEVSLSSAAHRLDSDCQTLVYEHYDKFLHATDLVHKLKEGSSEMEDQLKQLQDNMALITKSSSTVTAGLEDHRNELSRLLGAHNTLQKLEFLFKLPHTVDECIVKGDMNQAVESYLNTREVLERYRHLSSLAAVRGDCDQALTRLKEALHGAIAEGSPRELASSVELLLRLGEPRPVLQDSFLRGAGDKLNRHLESLNDLAVPGMTGSSAAARARLSTSSAEPSLQLEEKDHPETLEPGGVEDPSPPPSGPASTEAAPAAHDDGGEAASRPNSPPSRAGPDKRFSVDLLVFIDRCHDSYVTDLWLLISSYQEMFLAPSTQQGDRDASAKLQQLVDTWVRALLGVVRDRVRAEVQLQPLQCRVMATALDKMHRRLRALETMTEQRYYTQWSLELILEATELQCGHSLSALKLGLENTLADVRQGIASSSSFGSSELASLLSHLVATTAADIKQHISTLSVFLSSGCTFSAEDGFRAPFAVQQAREGVVVAFLRHLTQALAQFAGTNTSPLTREAPGRGEDGGLSATPASSTASSASLLLVLARAALDLHTSTAHYLLRECDDSLGVSRLPHPPSPPPTPTERVTSHMRTVAQQLLDAYVARQGAALAQLLMRSVELKDWLGCGEPHSVRRVVKTVREDVEACEAQVGVLYEEGTRKERSSDSSRRTYHSTTTPRGGGWSSSSRLSNSLRLSRLWSDRIEIYAAVRPDTLSITTAILKIALKSLEESVRLRTMGQFGLQQLQVDVHYLRVHLWRHVTDDSLLNALLDAVLTAAALRCNQPQLMEHSLVEFICDQ